MNAADEPAQAPTNWTAGAWERQHSQSLDEWRRSDASLSTPQLTTLCQAVNRAAHLLPDDPHALGAQLPRTRGNCNELYFKDPNETTAYTVQHLTDRYGRVTEILERLFTAGHLPLRLQQLSVLEIGSGPAPGLYATRDFYADLTLWAETTRQQPEFVPVTRLHALDRGEAWGSLLHHVSEHLMSLRSGLPNSSGPLPFHIEYDNLTDFSPIREHRKALDRAAALIFEEFDLADDPIKWSTAQRFAEEGGTDKPSAYDLILMCNFLTWEGSVDGFRKELRQLASSLTPGGLLITMGYPPWGKLYSGIWSDLRTLMRDVRLTELNGFEKPIQANQKPEWAKEIRRQRQAILDGLRSVNALPAEVSDLRETDAFPPFQVFIWKDQRPRRKKGA
jgi:hypothetical protein